MKNNKIECRLHRKTRIRKKITGSSDRPRLTVFKSLKHLYLQAIDDVAGKTLFSVSTRDKVFTDKLKPSKNIEAAGLIGDLMGQKILDSGIKNIVFDRNGYPYHGKVALIAKKVREKGVEF